MNKKDANCHYFIGVLGQLVIPIPVAGAVIGGVLGKFN